MSHPCRIPACPSPAKDRQLMCWPHWRSLPRALKDAIFETYPLADRASYRENVEEAVRLIQMRELGA